LELSPVNGDTVDLYWMDVHLYLGGSYKINALMDPVDGDFSCPSMRHQNRNKGLHLKFHVCDDSEEDCLLDDLDYQRRHYPTQRTSTTQPEERISCPSSY